MNTKLPAAGACTTFGKNSSPPAPSIVTVKVLVSVASPAVNVAVRVTSVSSSAWVNLSSPLVASNVTKSLSHDQAIVTWSP